MNVETRAISNATGAIHTVLEGLAKVRGLAEYDGFDDQLDRFAPMLTNFVAVVFAARPVVEKAVFHLRAACDDEPDPIGDHFAPCYHELALRLAEEPIWHMFSGMDARCMNVVMRVLSNLERPMTGGILDVEAALLELGGINDVAAAIECVRDGELPDVDLNQLLARVQKEGAIAVNAARMSSGEREPDNKTDNSKKSRKNNVPANPEVLKLAKYIKRERKRRPNDSLKSLALEFTNGDDAKAESRLRQLRRFPHLLD